MNDRARSILLVEDEPGLVRTLTDRLKREGFDVRAVSDGPTAERLLLDERYDLVLLDVMLPGRSGFEICERIRAKGLRLPVLMLTARSAVEDRVQGLELGADDYLVKPFEMRELLARVDALLRRVPAGNRQLKIGKGLVDFDAGTITVNGNLVEVSARSMKLLDYLVRNEGRVLSRQQLLREVWGYSSSTPTTRTVDVHVAILRRSLEEDPKNPRHIVTVHAVGYRFDARVSDDAG